MPRRSASASASGCAAAIRPPASSDGVRVNTRWSGQSGPGVTGKVIPPGNVPSAPVVATASLPSGADDSTAPVVSAPMVSGGAVDSAAPVVSAASVVTAAVVSGAVVSAAVVSG